MLSMCGLSECLHWISWNMKATRFTWEGGIDRLNRRNEGLRGVRNSCEMMKKNLKEQNKAK